MATKKEIEEINKLLREKNEILEKNRLITEESLDDTRELANILRDQTKELEFQVSEKNQLRSIGNSLTKIAQDSYNITQDELADLDTSKKLLEFQKKLKKDVLGLDSLRGKLLAAEPKLQVEIENNINRQIKAAKDLEAQLIKQLDITKDINNNSGVKQMSFLSDIAKAIPGLRKFAEPFKDAEQAARKAVLDQSTSKIKLYKDLRSQGMSMQSALKKAGVSAKEVKLGKSAVSGFSGLTAGLKSLGPAMLRSLGWIGALALAVKFIVDLFIAADENTTNIAKNLGISKSAAEGLRLEFVEIAAENENLLVTSTSLIAAQGELTQALGATTRESKNLAENQVFLTKNLGIAGDKAAEMQLMFAATNQNVDSVIDSTLDFARAQGKANGYLITGESILAEIANTSAEISGYYGFNNTALAKAVYTARQLGLTLMQTQSISKGLLDFESSISNELEAELLTGKALNFEKARMLALQGDSAGAAAEVLKQAQALTTEQRKNPIIMGAMAKAAGLSVEELNKAFLIEKKLKMSRKDYNELLERGAKTGKQEQVSSLAMLGRTKEEIEKTLTAQEKFAASLEKAKDQFTGLVNSGLLDDLADSIADLVGWIGRWTGNALTDAEKEKRSKLTAGKDGMSMSDATKLIKDARGMGIIDTMKFIPFLKDEKGKRIKYNAAGDAATKMIEESLARTAKSDEKAAAMAEPQMATGGIVTKPTRALVGEAGAEAVIPLTALYAKFDELIAAVNKGGSVYIDGNKAGEALMLGSYKLS